MREAVSPGDAAAASRRKLLLLAGVILVVSIFFWCWALLNTFRAGYFDLGVLSFAFSAFTAGGVVAQVRFRPQENMATPKSRMIMMASHILVTANYALGFSLGGVVGQSVGYRVYCALFTILWGTIAAIGFSINSEVIRSYEGEPLLGTLEDEMI